MLWVNHGHLTGIPKLSCVGKSQAIKGWWVGSLRIHADSQSWFQRMIFSSEIVGSVCEFLGMVYHMFLHFLIVFSTSQLWGSCPRTPPAPWDNHLPSRETNPSFRQALGLEPFDSLGRTPLMHATFTRSAEAVVWLARRKTAALGTPGCRTVYDYVCVCLFV